MKINLDKYNFKFKVINYLVMSGAEQSKFEWRTQSVKGLIRFWFRWAGGNKKREQEIFGGAGKKANASKFKLICSPIEFPAFAIQNTQSIYKKLSFGEKYLGYPFRFRSVRREILKKNNILQISIIFYPMASEKDKKCVLSSLWMAINLGNFGTRARKGFGSLFCYSQPSALPYNLSFIKKNNQGWRDWYKQNLSVIEKTFGQLLNFEVYFLNISLDDIGQFYRNYRRNIRPTQSRKIFGLPITGQSSLKPDRFASQFIIKPLDRNNCLIVLNTNPILPKEWENMNKNYFLEEIRGFINELNPTKIYP
jgi:CRISPR-associated protein Cmr1